MLTISYFLEVIKLNQTKDWFFDSPIGRADPVYKKISNA